MNHIITVYLLVCYPPHQNLVFVPNLGLSTVLTLNLGVMDRHPPNNEPHLDSLYPIFRAINSTYLKSGSDGPSSSPQWTTFRQFMSQIRAINSTYLKSGSDGPSSSQLYPIFRQFMSHIRAINSTYLKSGSDGPSSSPQWTTLNKLMATHKQTKIHQLFRNIFSSYKKKKQ